MKHTITITKIILPLKQYSFKFKTKAILIISTFISLVIPLTVLAQNTITDEKGEAYLFHINDYPSDDATDWSKDLYYKNTFHCVEYPYNPCNCTGNENECFDPNGCDDIIYQNTKKCKRDIGGGTGIQGIAHIKNHWIIITQYSLWKIPVGIDLKAGNLLSKTGVKKIEIVGVNELDSKGYHHFGDADCFTYKNKEYIFVPLTKGSSGNGPGVAVFDVNLTFLDYFEFPNISDGGGWCAISPGDSCLYASVNHPNSLYKYKIDWEKLRTKKKLRVTFKNDFDLKNITGGSKLRHMQGGVFSPSGDFLYVTCGILRCANFGWWYSGEIWPTDGMHVFKTNYAGTEWQEVEASINTERGQTGCFNYSFHNSDCALQEPEGIDFWDLDDGKAPHIRGQLHVSVAFHPGLWGDEKASFKHYRSFKCPNDITVFGTTAQGEPSTNPTIKNFLERGIPIGNSGLQSFNGCSSISNDAPNIFPPGKTEVTFTVHDWNFNLKCKANVKVVNKHDECEDALKIYSCEKVVTGNHCAGKSTSIPPMTGYSGAIKDVWYTFSPPSNFSIETQQVPGGITNPVMQLYKGTCDNLIPLDFDDNSGDDNHAKITLSNYSGTKPLYVRITDYNANNYGEFGIYFKKIAPGNTLFNEQSFISGDGSGIHDYPAHHGDVNGDGFEDIIYIGHGWNGQAGLHIRVKFSNGDGTYNSTSQIFSDGIHTLAYPVLTGDFNGDGKTDIATVFKSSTTGGHVIRTKISLGNGQFTAYQHNLSDGVDLFKYPTLTGDINGDGKTDIIFIGQNWVGNAGLTIRVKMSNGDGTFTSYSQAFGDGSGVHKYPALVTDINGDGFDDLIFTGYGWNNHDGLQVRVKFSNGNGTFYATSQKFADDEYVLDNPVLVGNFNADSLADLAFVFKSPTTGGLVIRTKMSDGNGQFTSYEEYMGDGVNIFENKPVVCDVNGDGMDDIAFAGQNWKGCGLNIRIKLSNGDGTWCADYQTLGDGSGVHKYAVLPGDYNADGKCDFVFHGQDWSGAGLNIRTKFSLATTCSNINNNQNRLVSTYNVFPNPSNSFVTITDDTNTDSKLSIQLLSQTGLVLFKDDNYKQGDQFDISKYKTGIYFIEIVNTETGGKSTQKIVKVE
jgi:hypothetical protein